MISSGSRSNTTRTAPFGFFTFISNSSTYSSQLHYSVQRHGPSFFLHVSFRFQLLLEQSIISLKYKSYIFSLQDKMQERALLTWSGKLHLIGNHYYPSLLVLWCRLRHLTFPSLIFLIWKMRQYNHYYMKKHCEICKKNTLIIATLYIFNTVPRLLLLILLQTPPLVPWLKPRGTGVRTPLTTSDTFCLMFLGSWPTYY